jgi:hypothetical protein
VAARPFDRRNAPGGDLTDGIEPEKLVFHRTPSSITNQAREDQPRSPSVPPRVPCVVPARPRATRRSAAQSLWVKPATHQAESSWPRQGLIAINRNPGTLSYLRVCGNQRRGALRPFRNVRLDAGLQITPQAGLSVRGIDWPVILYGHL